MSHASPRLPPRLISAAAARKLSTTRTSEYALDSAPSMPQTTPDAVTSTAATSTALRAMSAATRSSGATVSVESALTRHHLSLLGLHARHVALRQLPERVHGG